MLLEPTSVEAPSASPPASDLTITAVWKAMMVGGHSERGGQSHRLAVRSQRGRVRNDNSWTSGTIDLASTCSTRLCGTDPVQRSYQPPQPGDSHRRPPPRDGSVENFVRPVLDILQFSVPKSV